MVIFCSFIRQLAKLSTPPGKDPAGKENWGLKRNNNFVFEQKLFFLMKTMNVSAKRISQTRCSLTEPLYFYQLRSVWVPALDPRDWFQCGSGSSFYLNSDPDPGQTVTKSWIFTWDLLKVGNRSKNIPTNLQRYKSLFEGKKPGLLVNFGQFLCAWIRIRICVPSTDPDPGQPN